VAVAVAISRTEVALGSTAVVAGVGVPGGTATARVEVRLEHARIATPTAGQAPGFLMRSGRSAASPRPGVHPLCRLKLMPEALPDHPSDSSDVGGARGADR